MAPVLEEDLFEKGDDVIIIDTVNHGGVDLKGQRARVALWDPAHKVWAVKLGSTGEVVGLKTEKLQKIRHITLDELDTEKWMTIPKSEQAGVDFPKGIEVQMDMESGEKRIRKVKTDAPAPSVTTLATVPQNAGSGGLATVPQ